MVALSPHMAFYSGTTQHEKWSDLKLVHPEGHTLTDPDAKQNSFLLSVFVSPC
jgi:hypothetical protein